MERAHRVIRITGGELGAVHGLSDAMAQTMLAEMGTARRKWPDDQHVCAWLGCAPTNDRAAGSRSAADAARRRLHALLRQSTGCGCETSTLCATLDRAYCLLRVLHDFLHGANARTRQRSPLSFQVAHDILNHFA